MPSATLTPYYTNTDQITFALVSSGENKAVYQLAGRSLAAPYEVSIVRKVGQTGQKTNDHVVVTITQTAINTTTGIPATAVVKMDLSIPRDVSILTPSAVARQLGILGSLLNESTALEATTVACTALVNGRFL